MSLLERLREHAQQHKQGMVYDLLFAVVWVAVVSLLFDFVFVSAPWWALYLCLLAGVPAYFGFFMSLEAATSR